MSGQYEPLQTSERPQYRLYKRRFFGLIQLVLLNIVVSWSWLTFSAVSTTSSEFFKVSESAINWLSTGFLFAFVIASPATLYALNKYSPKVSILIASGLVLVGNWLRYAGTRASTNGNFPLVIVGQIVIGLSQPFVLASPTRYSDAWFSSTGRVTATAVASLANPLGGALGQLIGPLWATSPTSVPSLVLYISIISTVAALPSFFLPSLPPTPPSPSTSSRPTLSLQHSLHLLVTNPQFHLLSIPFAIYVAFFNASSSLINQFLAPYAFTEDEAGIAGALLIGVGLVASAIVSPVIDRTKAHLVTIKILVPLIAIGYLILIFAPGTRSLAAVYVVMALLGGASFSLLPCALEYMVDITWPVSPEVSSVTSWAAGQLLGGVFIVIMDALRGGWSGEPRESMKRALVFQAVVAWVALPLPLLLGLGKRRTIGRDEMQDES
ncbi:Major facilitator superfamily domain-containing protein 7-a [Sphaceloma murrayae]|uniref:Major facilitator superfamily domain-containing protein 7-a n=1 Tax=Sphaceloma murrayae TaxID=2082308 RepID=A0A2K1QNB6_9PEZI|nr:Major facilitator superfamily domain-containing protein 7-a [Sphaceloma murrayae]